MTRPPDVELTLDVNCPWTLLEVRAKAEERLEVRLKWLEEPLWPPENYDGLAQLREPAAHPSQRSNDCWQPKPWTSSSQASPKWVESKVAPIASVRNVTLMPHCFHDGPGLIPVIPSVVARGTADAMVEWRYFDLEAQLYGGALAPANGRISVPKRGIDPDPDVIRDSLVGGKDKLEASVDENLTISAPHNPLQTI